MASSSSATPSDASNQLPSADHNDLHATINFYESGKVAATLRPESPDSSAPPRLLVISFSETATTDLSKLSSLTHASATLFFGEKGQLQVVHFASDGVACNLRAALQGEGGKVPLDLSATFDPKADAAYVWLCKAKVHKSEPISLAPVPMVVDLDADGHIIGLEIIGANTVLPIRKGTIAPSGPSYQVGILTVSDRCSRGEAEDLSGPAIRQFLESEKAGKLLVSGFETACVPDERDAIARTLKHWSDNLKIPLILTTGGTGFAPRDVTPEATKDVLEKEAPGIVVAMISASLQVTPHAMLSRPAAGIRNKSLIINLPGSVKAVKENIAAIIVALPHAIGLIVDAAGSSTVSAHQEVAK